MKFTKKQIQDRHVSRRQFLAGAGSALLIPPLASLMPTSAAAAVLTPKRRFVVQMSYLGIDPVNFYPPDQTDMTPVAGAVSTSYKPLSKFSGPLSFMVDSSFASLYPKMNLMQGLSLTGGNWMGHNTCFLSGYHSFFRNPTHGRTLDVVMERSPNVYPANDTPTYKAIRVGTAPDSETSSTYDAMTGTRQVSSIFEGDVRLFNGIFLNLNGGAAPAVSDDKLIVDKVYSDLQTLQNDRRLASNDKNTLAEFIAGVFDLQTRINNTNALTCSAPALPLQATGSGGWTLPFSPGWNPNINCSTLVDNYIAMFKLAFACDLTRVIFMGIASMTSDLPIFQSEHHDAPSSLVAATRQKWGLMKFLALAQALDATKDPSGSGTLLDNTFMLYTNELGDWTTGHRILNMPVLTFGSCGGKFKTGYFMDYRQPQLKIAGECAGRPYKQLLQSAMLAMGVPKSEYSQFGDGQGYGEFVPNINQFGNVLNGAYSAYANEHNNGLPFVFTG